LHDVMIWYIVYVKALCSLDVDITLVYLLVFGHTFHYLYETKEACCCRVVLNKAYVSKWEYYIYKWSKGHTPPN